MQRIPSHLPSVLASDAERDMVISRLREATAEGRLTLEDFGARTEVALSCRTRDDLAVLTTDLPVSAPMPSGSGPVRREVAVFASLNRAGRWRLGHAATATAVFGSVNLDLRGALIDAPLITVFANVVFGSIDVVVPEGVEVEMEGAAVFGSRDIKLHHPPAPPGSPVVRVICSIYFGSVTVRGGKGLLDRALERFGISGGLSGLL